MTVLLARDLGSMPDQEAGKAGELVICREYLDDEFFGNELAAGSVLIQSAWLVKFKDNTAVSSC